MANDITTFEFDGSSCNIRKSLVHGNTRNGFRVTVRESGIELSLDTVDGQDLYENALWNLAGTRAMAAGKLISTKGANQSKVDLAWAADRVAYMFSLACRRIVRGK